MKIESIIQITTVPFYCLDITKWLRKQGELMYNRLFMLNFFEIDSFEKQKKHTQLLFEDFLMLTLNVFIFFKWINVPILDDKLSTGPIVAQCVTTVISIITTAVSLWIESNGLKENFIEYVMTSIKAKQDWVPFGYKVRNNEIEYNLDFSRIEFKIPRITDALGIYQALEY